MSENLKNRVERLGFCVLLWFLLTLRTTMNKIPLDLYNKALPKVRDYPVTVAFILQLLAGSIWVLKSNPSITKEQTHMSDPSRYLDLVIFWE